MWTKLVFVVFSLAEFSLHIWGKGLTCKDQNGQDVDWYVIYKFPEIKESSDPLIKRGAGFVYLDSNNIEWQESSEPIDSTNQAVGYTLQQVYKNTTDVLYAFYNDEKPDTKGSKENHGHTKGAVGADSISGFWLVHSVPHFPEFYKEGYEYPHTGYKYGQAMLCMSLAMKSLNKVGLLFQYNYPYIYDGFCPDSLATVLPHLKEVIGGNQTKVKSPPWNMYTVLPTLGNTQFKAFAKASEFNKDLYDGFVAPELHSALNVESWLHTQTDLKSNCQSSYKVCNIDSLDVNGVKFSEQDDHAKWAVTVGPGVYDTCIGDINRAVSQEKRGGGTVCLEDKMLNQLFVKSINQTQPCPASSSSCWIR